MSFSPPKYIHYSSLLRSAQIDMPYGQLGETAQFQCEFKHQQGRCVTPNHHNHKIPWILFLARSRRLSKVVPCMRTLCWSKCSTKCIWEKVYASLGRDLHCAQSNEEIKGVWRQKQEAICHTIHSSMLCLSPVLHSFPWSVLYHIETIFSECWTLPAKTQQYGICMQFLNVP